MRDILSKLEGWKVEGRYWVRESDGFRLPVIQGGGKAVTVQNDRYVFGTDNGSESGHSLDTENTDRGAQAADVTFLIRIQVEETGGVNDTWTFQLYAQKNGGGGFTAVTRARTDGLRLADDTQSRTDGEATTERLTAGAGSWMAGEYDDGGTSDGMENSITLNSQYTDLEFAIEIDSANASTSDYWEFRIESNAGVDLDSYPGSLPKVTATTIPVNISLSTATLTASGQSISVSTPGGEVFRIDLEEGNTSDFTSLTDTGSDITVTGGAAMVGTYGMQIAMDGTITDIFGHKSLSLGTNELRFRFYFDINDLSMADGDKFHLLDISTDSSGRFGYVNFRYTTAGGFEVSVVAWTDADAGIGNVWFAITGEHYIEVYFKRETADTQADGVMTWWVDGSQKGTDTDVDNYNIWSTVDEFTLGGNDIDAGTSGNPYYDDLIVRDDNTEIGADGGITVGLNTASLTAGGQVLALSMGAATTGLNTASLTAEGQALALSMGAIATALNTAALTAGGQALSLSMGTATVGLSTATLTAGGQVITISIDGGPLTISLSTATLTAGGQVLALAPGEATTSLNTATITVNGQAISFVMGEATVGLNTALITVVGQVLSLAPGAASVGLATATITAGGQSITISLSTLIALNTAALTASGQALSLSMGAVSTGLNTASITAGGQSLSLLMGEAVVLLDTALATANGQALALLMGAVSTGLNTATLTASGQAINIVLIGALSVALNTATLTANGQAIYIVVMTPDSANATFIKFRDTRAILEFRDTRSMVKFRDIREFVEYDDAREIIKFRDKREIVQ